MREKCTNKGKREAKIEAKPDRGATVTPERKVREEIFPLIKRDTDIKDMSNVTYKHESGGVRTVLKEGPIWPPRLDGLPKCKSRNEVFCHCSKWECKS